MSFKPEVIADSSGKWCGNSLRFATKAEAEANVNDLMMRWFAVRETRVVESNDPVTHTYVDGQLGDALKAKQHTWNEQGFCVYCHNVHRTDNNARSTCSDGFTCAGSRAVS